MKTLCVCGLVCSVVAAQPVPRLGEDAAAYLNRWDAWVDLIPEDQRAISEMLDVDRWFREMEGREGGQRYLMTSPPGDDDPEDLADWEWSLRVVREHPERMQQIRSYADRQAVGASLRESSWRFRREHKRLIDIQSATPEYLDDISPEYWALLREHSLLLRVDSFAAITEGDGDRLICNLQAIEQIGQLNRVTGAWIDHLLQQSHQNIILRLALSDEVDFQGLDQRTLQAFLQVLDGMHPQADALNALKHERVVVLDRLHWLSIDQQGDRFGPAGVARYIDDRGRALSRMSARNDRDTRERAQFLLEGFVLMLVLPNVSTQAELINAYFDSFQHVDLDAMHAMQSFPEAFSELDDLERETDQSLIIARYLVSTQALRYGLVYSPTCIDAARLKIHADLYRLEHGVYPTGLIQLDGVFTDRYSGQSLRYALHNGRPKIYSVGADRDDDGGRPASYPRNSMEYFTLDEWKDLDPSLADDLDGDLIFYPPAD